MVKISVEQLRSLMDNQSNIRNISVVAHVDHGKSTLTDSLLSSNGIISKEDAGKRRATDTRDDEQLRGITIKSTGVSLHYELPKVVPLPEYSNGSEFLVNLIDSPGHVDFSSEVTAALRLTDGALVLVDCVEGSCVQTETVLRQALAERIKPVLAINKLDRAFLELQLSSEEMYQAFCRSVEQVNAVISTYEDRTVGDRQVYPDRGSVVFSAGKQGWAFTLPQFARMYEKTMNVESSKLVKRLWGDYYFDPETKKWSTSSTSASGKVLSRGFCKFVIEPITQVFNACNDNNIEKLEKLLNKVNITLTAEEKNLRGKELLRATMQKWLPASDALLETIVTHLPSPVAAQKYRVESLYTGPLDDETAKAIRDCDPNGPLVMFISKMIPTKDNSRFYAFGRVFSGTVSNQRVRVMGNNYTPGTKDDLATNVPIQRVVIMMGAKAEAVGSVPCGNTCALVGIDNFLAKSGTVVNLDSSYPLANMKYSVSAVVRVAIEPEDPADLPKLVEALKRLSKSDPLIKVTIEPTGEYIIAGAGELHLEICLEDLRSFMHGARIKVTRPAVPFMETVIATSESCLAKSPNRHNRLYAKAEPLGEELTQAYERGDILPTSELKETKKLVQNFGWDVTEAKKIWAFGPDNNGSNLLVDGTKGIQYMNEVKDHVNTGFQVIAKKGVLAEECLRGVRFTIVDANLHADAIHRGAGQIIPVAQRSFSASQLCAKPRLVEPVYLVDIQCPLEVVSGVYNVLSQRRGTVIEAIQRFGTPLYNVKGYLPVLESFGFTAALRSQTSGKAFPQCIFDHWQVIEEDPLEATKARDIVVEIRKRKGLDPNIPPLERFLDKL